MTDDAPTSSDCFANAARLLRNAEGETDRDLMDKFDMLARSWMMLAGEMQVASEDTAF